MPAPLSIKRALSPYHVVQIKHEGVHVTYAIYWNNTSFLEPDRLRVQGGHVPPLSKRTAFKLIGLLNAEHA